MPKVLNRHHNLQGEEGIYIGRGTPFGNPYTHLKFGPGPAAGVKVETREEAVAGFRVYFYERLEQDPIFKEQVETLRGHNLVCSCAPLACHGDVIMEYLERS